MRIGKTIGPFLVRLIKQYRYNVFVLFNLLLHILNFQSTFYYLEVHALYPHDFQPLL